jgi:hypothetical protein
LGGGRERQKQRKNGRLRRFHIRRAERGRARVRTTRREFKTICWRGRDERRVEIDPFAFADRRILGGPRMLG